MVQSINLRFAWVLLALAFGLAALALSGVELDTVGPQTQIAFLRMGLLQALLAGLFAASPVLQPLERRLGLPLAVGAVVYPAGFLVPALVLLVPVTAALNLCAVGVLLIAAFRGSASKFVRAVLIVVAFGMALDLWLGLTEWDAALIPAYLAPSDSVRLRMFRLARIAAIALPLFAVLHADLLEAADDSKRHVRWSRGAIRIGAVALPIALVLTALTWTNRKQLVSMASLCMMFGTTVAALLASRQQRRLESFGWWLMTGSMFIGYLIAGFAFGGPFPVPDFMGEHDSVPRTMVRGAHTLSIAAGLLMVLFGRTGAGRAAALSLVVGAVATSVTLIAGGFVPAPDAVLAIGPAVVALAIVARSVSPS